MIRRLVFALAALTVLTGCAAGPNAVTLKQYTPTDGNQATSGSIKVRNLVLVTGADAATDSNVTIIGTILNTGETTDTLQSITVNSVPVTLQAETLDLVTNTPLTFGGETANATGTVSLPTVSAGQIVDVQMVFAQAGLVETTALVREATLEFAP